MNFLGFAVDQVAKRPVAALVGRAVAKQVNEVRGTEKRPWQMVNMHSG
jgi:hypothetical protein